MTLRIFIALLIGCILTGLIIWGFDIENCGTASLIGLGCGIISVSIALSI